MPVSTIPELSPAQLTAISNVLGTMQDDQTIALDPTNSDQYTVIESFFLLNSLTSEAYPGLNSSLQEQKDGGTQNPQLDENIFKLLFIGINSSDLLSGTSWHSVKATNGIVSDGLLALDASGNPIGFGVKTLVGENTVVTDFTDTIPGDGVTPTVSVMAHFSVVVPSGSNAIPYFMLTKSSDDLTLLGEDATFTLRQPVEDPETGINNEINVALARKESQANRNKDVDYIYLRSGSNKPSNLLVPLDVDIQVDGILEPEGLPPGVPLPGAEFESYLLVASSGGKGQVAELSADNNIPNGITTINGNTFKVSYPYIDFTPPAPNPNTMSSNSSLKYDYEKKANDTITYFYSKVTVNLQDPAGGTKQASYVIMSEVEPSDPTECQGLEIVPPVKYWWHCLAEGTEVTLENGKTMKIEDVSNEERVHTGKDDITLGVEATVGGEHDTEGTEEGEDAIYKLKTEDGHKLKATGAHVIYTENGPMAMEDLKPGINVNVEGGKTSPVKSCKPVKFKGDLYNLKLIDAEDRKKDLKDAQSSYLANGIVVGSESTIHQIHKQKITNLEYMKTKIDSKFHSDYASALKAMA